MADHDNWEPLSEPEMKLITARRDRSDQISKLMGDYLLKGYKMLASTCRQCQTILLQDRQGSIYCVACSELDTDTGKDDPVINESAAISMAREMELASALAAGDGSSLPRPGAATAGTSGQLGKSVSPKPMTTVPEDEPVTSLSMTSIDVQSWPPNAVDLKPPAEAGQMNMRQSQNAGQRNVQTGTPYKPASLSLPESSTADALNAKIVWASQELSGTHSVEYSTQLCQLIKAAAEALVALRTERA